MTDKKIDYQRLLYRNQFILGHEFIDYFDNWQRIEIQPNLKLTAHSELNVCIEFHKEKYIALIGFILDPIKPEWNDRDIIKALVFQMDSCASVFDAIYGLGGRWVLIVHDGDNTIIFNDAFGIRQIYYSERSTLGSPWCASQPALIGKHHSLLEDEDTTAFIKWHKGQTKEHWIPNTRSQYRGILRLFPNHYLDLSSGQVSRFWPTKLPEVLSVEKVIHDSADLLKGMIKSGASRFDLGVSLSAGWDSRLVLASCKEQSNEIQFFSVQREGMLRNFPDVKVPKKLAKKIGINHEIVRINKNASQEFIEIFEKHAPFPHIEQRSAGLEGLLRHYEQKKVALTGNLLECVRIVPRYWKYWNGSVTPGTLAEINKMVGQPFAIDGFSDWLNKIPNESFINPLTLFRWEYIIGSWLSSNCLEFDLAWPDVFLPFNSRRLIQMIGIVDPKMRFPPDYLFFKRLINELWPEVLKEPINPPFQEKSFGVKKIIRKITG